MLRNITGQDILYFAASPFLLLCNGKASNWLHIYSEYAERYWLSLCSLNISYKVVITLESGNMLFSEIWHIFLLWHAEQGLNLEWIRCWSEVNRSCLCEFVQILTISCCCRNFDKIKISEFSIKKKIKKNQEKEEKTLKMVCPIRKIISCPFWNPLFFSVCCASIEISRSTSFLVLF